MRHPNSSLTVSLAFPFLSLSHAHENAVGTSAYTDSANTKTEQEPLFLSRPSEEPIL